MELTNSFEVTCSIDQTWAVLTDVELIAPCLPGAQLQEIEDDEYRGIVKVKVGPITAQYKGAATFVEKNDDDFKVVLDAKGRDTRGAGNAEAVITATLEAVSDTTTRVDVSTDLKVTGKVAQFGRGVMADVSSKLMDQFADNLQDMLDEGGAAPVPADAASGNGSEVAAEPEPAAAPDAGPRQIDAPEAEAVDLLDAAGTPVLKRLAPIIAIVVVLLILRRLLRAEKPE
jgi:carbon monoxide dehydrogenase subunit G